MSDIYLDNAAATMTDPKVIRVVSRASVLAGNPSSFNNAGRTARVLLDAARADVATFLGARSSEVIFCASGSEANNLAISGIAQASNTKGHVITTPIEHLSVLEPVEMLSRYGWKVSYAAVDGAGVVSVDDITARITSATKVVSVMYANNEIGTIQPIKKIARAIAAYRRRHRSKYPYVHVDACQAAGWLPMNVQELGVDLLTFNGSKVHGPRGTAVLYVRRGVLIAPVTLGGSQEHGLRAGTENLPGAVGLAMALKLIRKSDVLKTAALRDRFLEKLPIALADARINGSTGNNRLANNINLSIPGCDSERLLLELDKHGIRAGSGSACTAHAIEPSHVLRAIGTPKKYLDGALRLSLSRHSTRREVDVVLGVLPKVVAAIRAQNT